MELPPNISDAELVELLGIREVAEIIGVSRQVLATALKKPKRAERDYLDLGRLLRIFVALKESRKLLKSAIVREVALQRHPNIFMMTDPNGNE